MTFGNPVYLKLLPLALLPLALHLFYPRRRRVVPFAPFMLLSASRRHPAIRRRLREVLLLLLRMTAVAAAVLALARPHLRSITLGHTASSTGAVIVLDDTLSMQRTRPGGGTAFEQARSTALELLEALPPECRIGVVCASGAPGMPLSGDRKELREAIAAVQQTGCSGGLREAITAAVGMMTAIPPGGRQFILLSDFQENALPAGGVEALRDARVYGQALGTPDGNCSVGRPVVDALPKAAGRPLRIAATVTNHGLQPRELHLRLEINGVSQEERVLAIPGEDHVTQEFLYTPSASGDLSGRLVMDDGEISLDDSADFQVPILGKVPVLLIEDASAGNRPLRYFQEALNLLKSPDGCAFRCQEATTDEAQTAALEEFRMVAIAPSAATPASLAAPVTEYLRKGGAVMIFPEVSETEAAQSADESPFVSALAAALKVPALYDGNVRTAESGMELLPPLQSWNSQLELELIHWNRLRTPAGDGARLLAINRQGALLATRSVGKGTLMLFGMLPNRSCGNWPELKSFPIMMLAFADCALGNTERVVHLLCGESAVLNGESPQWLQEDGHASGLPGGQWGGSRLPGITRFRNASCTVAITLPPPDESDTACLSSDEAAQRLGVPVTWLLPGEDPAAQIADLQAGTDTTGGLLLLALAAITAEFLLGLGCLRKKDASQRSA